MESIANIAGAVMGAAGLALIWQAWTRRRLVIAEARRRAETGEPESGPPLHHSLRMLGAIGPGIVQIGLFIAGGQVVLAYLVTGGSGVFTLFDLAGFLFLLAAYGWWIAIRTRYRPGYDPVRD
ncbi:MAG: hypothetical protein NZM27_08025 [Acetobacteraceae bacterium]|nr:hypothetical protein [Acetobacteraceae bacterium]MCX7683837.1 hypothetical protein [Acetobacteraceae bacterium]MDW8397775.1 hypothetical protein [Acetobacteraceae bacterium]